MRASPSACMAAEDKMPSSSSTATASVALSKKAKAFSVAALIAVAETPTGKEDHRRSSFSAFRPLRPRGKNSLDDARVELHDCPLWRRFYELGTEMIVTKAGRRMFPNLKFNISGLDPTKRYHMYLDMVAVDDRRYKYGYHNSRWLVAGRSDPPPVDPPSYYVHPGSPSTGANWMRQVVSFDKVKLTNNETNGSEQLVLNSMHRYRPRLIVVEAKENESPPKLSDLYSSSCDCVQFTFPETEFIAVTAYQNQQITKLKIDSNPFAKGFRESRESGRFNVIDSCLEAFYKHTPQQQKQLESIPSFPQRSAPHNSYVSAPVSQQAMLHWCRQSTPFNSCLSPSVFASPTICSRHYSHSIVYSARPPFSPVTDDRQPRLDPEKKAEKKVDVGERKVSDSQPRRKRKATGNSRSASTGKRANHNS